jgi:Na+-driven multidrug efflux pump
MEDLTTGPLTRHLLKTTSFMLVTMIFQTLYFLIDLYWVGRLGTHAVAAVAIAGNFTLVGAQGAESAFDRPVTSVVSA